MEFITNLLNNLNGLNIEPILQLTLVALVMLSGPVIIFLLAFRGGDL
jgi:Photosystem II complex subunit Ycf12